MSSSKPTDLLPIDWAGIELEHRAGIAPLRAIAKRFGCTHGAITKRAKKEHWIRDLRPKIHARAEELVSRAALREVSSAVSSPASIEAKRSETVTVEANAIALSIVQLEHRSDIGRARRLVVGLLGELEAVCEMPDLFGMVHLALTDPSEDSIEALHEMARMVASLPARVRVAKDLADALHKLIGAEREAFGLDTIAGTDGRPMVIIRDFTGRGDPDSPRAQEPEP